MVERKGGPKREVEERDPGGGECLGVGPLHAAPEALAEEKRSCAAAEPQGDPAPLGDPVILEGVFEEERQSQHYGDDTDAADPG